MGNNSILIQDILPYSNKKGVSKKIDIDAVLPFIILPVLLLIACISRTVTIIVMIVTAMGVLYIYSRPRQKNRSPFFFSWTVSSGVYLFLIFVFEVLTLLEITQLENFILIILIACTCYCFRKVRSVADFELATGSSKGKEYSPVLTADSYYCHICQIEVNERYFHSLWWDCCIFRPNYGYFLAGLCFALLSLLFGANLGLTSICQPYLFYGTILMPEDCSDVYYEFSLAISFVACMYALGYTCIIILVLIHQLIVYIPKYTEPQWRRIFHVFTA